MSNYFCSKIRVCFAAINRKSVFRIIERENQKMFKIEIKNYVREILFRIYNQFIDLLNFIQLCDKIDQNYYYYQRDRSKYSNFHSVFIKQCFFLSFRFGFDLLKTLQNNFNYARTTKFVSNVIYQIINRMFVVFFFVSIFDFVNLKSVFCISNLFFEIIRFM